MMTTRLTSMATSAMRICSLLHLTSVIQLVKTAIIHGLPMTLSSLDPQTQPVDACLSREPHKATPTARANVRTTRVEYALAAVTADGAGRRMTQKDGFQQSPCVVASLRKSRLTSVTRAITSTMASVVLIAQTAAGLGLRMTLTGGIRVRPTVDAQPLTSKRSNLAAAATL